MGLLMCWYFGLDPQMRQCEQNHEILIDIDHMNEASSAARVAVGRFFRELESKQYTARTRERGPWF